MGKRIEIPAPKKRNNELIQAMVDLKGHLSEPLRAIVVNKVAKALHDGVLRSGQGQDAATAFSKNFVLYCALEEPEPFAPADLEVDRSELASFIDRWIHVQQFKRKDAEEFEPITPEMNEVRVSMCAELLELGNYDPAAFGLV